MKTLTDSELERIAGSGDPLMPTPSWPAPGYTPPAPASPPSSPGNVSPRHVDN
jgi:hypothetical protein